MPRLQIEGIFTDQRPEGFVAHHRLFLPSDSLLQLQLFSGACVSVKSNNVQTFCTIRPLSENCSGAYLSSCAAGAMNCVPSSVLECTRPIRVSSLPHPLALSLKPLGAVFQPPFRLPSLTLVGQVICEGCVITVDWFNQPTLLRVIDIQPESKKRMFVIGPNTKIEFAFSVQKSSLNDRPAWIRAVCAQFSGYAPLVQELVDGISHCLTCSSAPRNPGYLLHGVPGCGKTSLALSLALHSGAPSFVIQGPQLFGVDQGSAERALSDVFQRALAASPSIVIFDEIDVICPQQGSLVEMRVLAHFLGLLDNLRNDGFRQEEHKHIFVIATTCRFQEVDPALQGHRLRPVEIHAPTTAGRLELLRHCCNFFAWGDDSKESLQDSILSRVSQQTQGFVGGDLQALCREALMHATRNRRGSREICVTEADFAAALRGRLPANLASLPFRSSNPNVKFSQLAGLDLTIAKLRQLLIQPYLHPDLYLSQQKNLGISLPTGILLHGPPGTGKTSLALAVANECNMNVLVVHGAQLVAKHVGDSEKAVGSLFDHARKSAPCLIVVDQFEVFAPRRVHGGGPADRMLSCLLMELNGISGRSESLENRIMVIATTSCPHLLDPAVLRPGRLDEQICVAAPDEEARAAIMLLLLARMSTGHDRDREVLALSLAQATPGYSGADLSNLAREAGLLALREDLGCNFVASDHFFRALCTTKPSLAD